MGILQGCGVRPALASQPLRIAKIVAAFPFLTPAEKLLRALVFLLSPRLLLVFPSLLGRLPAALFLARACAK